MQVEGKWIRDPGHKRQDLAKEGFHPTNKGWSDSPLDNSPGERSALDLRKTLERLLPAKRFAVVAHIPLSAYNIPADAERAAAFRKIAGGLSAEEFTRVEAIGRLLMNTDLAVVARNGKPPFPFRIEIDGIQHQGNGPRHFEPPEGKASQIHTDRVKDCCARLNHGAVMLRVGSTPEARKKIAAAIIHATRYSDALECENAAPEEARAEIQRFCDAACFYFAGGGNLKTVLGRDPRPAAAYRSFADSMRDSIVDGLRKSGRAAFNPEQDKLLGIWLRDKALLREMLVTMRGRGDDKRRIGFVRVHCREYYDAYRFGAEIERAFRGKSAPQRKRLTRKRIVEENGLDQILERPDFGADPLN